MSRSVVIEIEREQEDLDGEERPNLVLRVRCHIDPAEPRTWDDPGYGASADIESVTPAVELTADEERVVRERAVEAYDDGLAAARDDAAECAHELARERRMRGGW